MSTNNFDQLFTECGAYWRHNGNLSLPFVRTTSGYITDGFFNGQKVMEDGHLFGLSCQALWRMADGQGVTGKDLRVVGPEMGGILMSSRLSEVGKCLGAYCEKVHDHGPLLHFAFARFTFDSSERFLLTEDTITSGRSIELLEAAVRRACDWQPTVEPFVLALCNRSGLEYIAGRKVLSLVTPMFKQWRDGENPHTPDGKEIVEPIRAAKYSWKALQQTA